MALPLQPYKGARDFYPEDKRLQKYLFGVLRHVVESFGYQEYDAPIIEPIELYLAKSSQEIVSEQTYNFLDRGGRHVTLRPEMTPSVSRMVAARRQELSYPLRWYSIPNLWRYERPQHGRLREHWQLNVDLFGVPGIEGDHELILLADSIMQAFSAKSGTYSIKISSRALINWLMLEYLRLEFDQAASMARLVDRMAKISKEDFKLAADNLLTPHQRDSQVVDKLLELLKVNSIEQLPLVIQQHPAVNELSRLFRMLNASGVEAEFDLSLMRGFDYYTDIVFEVFDSDPSNNRSMFGGGRYDGLIAEFGVDPVPTVGFGMGDVTLLNFLKNQDLLPGLGVETDAIVVLVGDVYEAAQGVITEMRKEGIKLAVDSSGRKFDAQLKSAIRSGVSYVLFIGPDELEQRRFKLKDLKSAKQHELSLERVVSTLASRRLPPTEL